MAFIVPPYGSPNRGKVHHEVLNLPLKDKEELRCVLNANAKTE